MGKKGLLPLIRSGTWVRLSGSTSNPDWARGQNAVVLRAPIEHVGAGTGEDIDPAPYARQDPDAVFLVRVRENGRELEVKRDAFAAVATNVGDLVNVGGRGVAPEDQGPNVPSGELVYVGKDKWVDWESGDEVVIKSEEKEKEEATA